MISRRSKRAAARLEPALPRSRRESGEAGFTLIELLMVMLILPLIMGAIAAAIIVSIDNEQTVSNRLADSVNGQLTSAYYVRDVQGASFVTTNAVSTPYSSTSPQVCAPLSSPGTPLVGFYRPATTSGTALDVGYWWTPSQQVVRASCTLTSTYTSTSPINVVIADHVLTRPPVSIQPTQFATLGWAPTVAETTVTSVSGSTINVVSTTGFAGTSTNTRPLSVVTALGTVQVTGCYVSTAGSPGVFTCSGSLSSVLNSDPVTQDSIAAVNLDLSQSPANPAGGAAGVEYRYALSGSPRTQSWCGAGAGTSSIGCNAGGEDSGNGVALLVDGNGGVSQNGNTALNVTGTAAIDGGNVNCAGGGSFTATGGISQYPSATGCNAVSGSFVPDPYQNKVPSCFPTQAPGGTATKTIRGQQVTVYLPGRYTSALNIHGNYYLEPGVYELDGGINVGNNSSISMDPSYNGSGLGVLLYLPGPSSILGCAGWASSSANFSLSGQGAVNLPPLSTNQSQCYFGGQQAGQNCALITTSDPGGNAWVGGMWIWQDAHNANPADLGGGTSATGPGVVALAYLPSASVTLHGGPGAGTGQLICAGLVLKGGSAVTISG
jgi:prepilin-type N-terminal cleavage/methylation domain-containing protein